MKKIAPPLTRKEMRRSAYWLRMWANALACSDKVQGKFPSTAGIAKAEHDEMMHLSKRLYANARAAA